ncbi:phosphotransferase [Heyndrickxia sp. MSNUG]|uniref:phosphotransferase n=1 Tax=Heyndrickxia sp. MSNUG TaxID=3136677 RepID=UPI003C2C3AE1
MKIESIILELKNLKIIQDCWDYKKLSGGTTSELYLLQSRYVIKKNEPQVLKAEAVFLEEYSEIQLLPTLIYEEPENNYIVYSYIRGESIYKRKFKRELLIELVQNIFNHYKIVETEGVWGWADEPSSTWKDFLLHRASGATTILKGFLSEEDHELIYTLINKKGSNTINQPYLLHGDCGVHNFIFEESKLTGVIDPTPVIGPRLYDLIYAFCSSPNDLKIETIEAAANTLLEDTKNLYEDVLIGLYLRIATCIKHHPADFDDYLNAWEFWKRQIKQEKEAL